MWLGVCLGRDGAYGDGDQGRDEPGADFLHMTSKDKKSPRAVAAGLNKEPMPFRGVPGEAIEGGRRCPKLGKKVDSAADLEPTTI